MGSANSNVVMLVVLAPCAQPTFSPVAGTYTGTQTVTISTVTSGAAIYYTTDGSTPTFPVTGTTLLYSGPVSVAASETLKAVATKAGLANSTVGTAAYVINIPVPSTVVIGTVNSGASPFSGLWETQFDGYSSAAAPAGATGTCTPAIALGKAIMCLGYIPHDPWVGGGPYYILCGPVGTAQTFFTSLQLTKAGGTQHTFLQSAASFTVRQDNGDIWGGVGSAWPTWLWTTASDIDFADGINTTAVFNP